MTYRLVYTERAKRDLEQAVQYIARKSPEAAQLWFEGFTTSLAKLKVTPLACGQAPESKKVEPDIRQYIYRTKSRRLNRALFTVVDQTVYILSIHRPGRQLLTKKQTEDLLNDLE